MDKKAIINALRNFAQATSNEMVGTVSGPIDLANAGLGYAGLGVKEPIGGSAWMERHGIIVPVPEGTAKTLGEITGMLLPIVGAAKAPQIAAALRNMGENMAKPRGGGMGRGQRGAIAWHSSPYEFDWFDASKIGTGQGTQAYGHGLYLAQSPKVAKRFQQSTSGGASKAVNASYSQDPELWVAGQIYSGIPKQDIAEGLQTLGYKGDANKLIEQGANRLNAELNVGSLYKVDLPDEHIARMLDWDKPLSQQPENVRQILSNFPETKKGGEIYQQLKRDLAVGEKPIFRYSKEGQKEAAEYLKQANIPGIRYLDGGSRSAGGSGSSNFVVFPGNEGILRILERNGAPVSTQNLVKALRNGN